MLEVLNRGMSLPLRVIGENVATHFSLFLIVQKSRNIGQWLFNWGATSCGNKIGLPPPPFRSPSEFCLFLKYASVTRFTLNYIGTCPVIFVLKQSAGFTSIAYC